MPVPIIIDTLGTLSFRAMPLHHTLKKAPHYHKIFLSDLVGVDYVDVGYPDGREVLIKTLTDVSDDHLLAAVDDAGRRLAGVVKHRPAHVQADA